MFVTVKESCKKGQEMSEQEIIEWDGVEYVKIPYTAPDCGECVFFDTNDGVCTKPDCPALDGCKDKFIWAFRRKGE